LSRWRTDAPVYKSPPVLEHAQKMHETIRLCAIAMLLVLWSSPARTSQSCTLIGAPDMAAIFGGPIEPGVEGDIQAALLCGFTHRNETINVGVMPTSMVNPNPTAAFDAAVAAGEVGAIEPIPGLGEKAVYVAANAGTSVADYDIYVLVGTRILNIDVTGTNDPDIKSALIAAARRIVENL